MKFLLFPEKHKGIAAMIGGFASVTIGATYWLAKGGAVAFITSMNALSQPAVAAALIDLPDYHQRTAEALASLASGQEETQAAVGRIADVLDAYRVNNEQVVEWAPDHSQRLTDAAGGCFAGQKDCTVYFRGRRTQSGLACVFDTARPRLVLADGQEFPVQYSQGSTPVQLTGEFETIPVMLEIPGFIPPGIAGVVILTFYAECPFAGDGEVIERETFRLLVEIRAAQ